MISFLLLLISSSHIAMFMAIPFEIITWLSYMYISKGFLKKIRKDKKVLILDDEELKQFERFIFGAGISHLAMITFLLAVLGGISLDWSWVYLVTMMWTGITSLAAALLIKNNDFGEIV